MSATPSGKGIRPCVQPLEDVAEEKRIAFGMTEMQENQNPYARRRE